MWLRGKENLVEGKERTGMGESSQGRARGRRRGFIGRGGGGRGTELSGGVGS